MTTEQVSTELALYSDRDANAAVLEALLGRHARAKEALRGWEWEEKEAAAALQAFLGTTTRASLDGSEVVTFDYKDQFRGKDFEKDYPDLAKRFTRTMEVDRLDVEWLKSVHPEVWALYRTRALLNKYSVRPPARP